MIDSVLTSEMLSVKHRYGMILDLSWSSLNSESENTRLMIIYGSQANCLKV